MMVDDFTPKVLKKKKERKAAATEVLETSYKFGILIRMVEGKGKAFCKPAFAMEFPQRKVSTQTITNEEETASSGSDADEPPPTAEGTNQPQVAPQQATKYPREKMRSAIEKTFLAIKVKSIAADGFVGAELFKGRMKMWTAQFTSARDGKGRRQAITDVVAECLRCGLLVERVNSKGAVEYAATFDFMDPRVAGVANSSIDVPPPAVRTDPDDDQCEEDEEEEDNDEVGPLEFAHFVLLLAAAFQNTKPGKISPDGFHAGSQVRAHLKGLIAQLCPTPTTAEVRTQVADHVLREAVRNGLITQRRGPNGKPQYKPRSLR